MFLSRLTLNPYNWHVRRDLSNCHEMHRTILSGFPEDIKRHNGGVRANFNILYRLTISTRVSALRILVQSAVKPDWSNLPKEYLLYNQGRNNPEIKDISSVLKMLKENLVIRFRLMANPTKKINGQRIPIYGYEGRIKWLERKGIQYGFNLIQVKINKDILYERYAEIINQLKIETNDDYISTDVITHNSIKVIGWKMKEKSGKSEQKKHRLTFEGVFFDGYLKITEKDKFIDGLKTGIGSGKSYGFGLLSIAPS
ncbi:MAG: type I-E CRISPR-associated protein Cas6/Cse3/CasE [Candidatus Thorarchaeota archaeon]